MVAIVARLGASCSHNGVELVLWEEELALELDEEEVEEVAKSLVRRREEMEDVADPTREREVEERDASSEISNVQRDSRYTTQQEMVK